MCVVLEVLRKRHTIWLAFVLSSPKYLRYLLNFTTQQGQIQTSGKRGQNEMALHCLVWQCETPPPPPPPKKKGHNIPKIAAHLTNYAFIIDKVHKNL